MTPAAKSSLSTYRLSVRARHVGLGVRCMWRGVEVEVEGTWAGMKPGSNGGAGRWKSRRLMNPALARRFVAHVPAGAPNDYPLEAGNYVREFWGEGREATYEDFPLLGRGPFGNAFRIRRETDPDFRPFLFVPRDRLDDSPLDIKGAGRSVSVAVFDRALHPGELQCPAEIGRADSPGGRPLKGGRARAAGWIGRGIGAAVTPAGVRGIFHGIRGCE